MKVWLIQRAEPLPIDGPTVRLMRTGILAQLLVDQGHDVLWWTSTFNHHKKVHRFDCDASVQVSERYRIRLTRALGYRRNISVGRLVDHRWLAHRFARQIDTEPTPDVILSSFPNIELCAIAARYGRARGVPVIVDIRDLWPDIFAEVLPAAVRPVARLALWPFVRQTRYALRHCTAVTAVCQEFLSWGLRHAGREAGELDGVFPLGYRPPTATEEEIERGGASLRAMGVDPRQTICWFLGQMGAHYDLETIVRAAGRFAAEGVKNMQFVLSGDGEQRPRLTRLAEGLPNLVFTGWISTHQIAYMMRVADVGLAAYRPLAGTLPNKIFEYFSAGLPVLSTLRGEAVSLLAENGCGASYEAGDVDGLVGALSVVLADPDRRKRMGANALRLYKERFSADVVYPRMVDMLMAAADSARSARAALGSAHGVGVNAR